MKKTRIIRVTQIGIFAALSAVLYILKFPLPFIFPSFLEIQFSNLPAIIGGFALGPIGGAIIVTIKFLVLLPLSKTAFVGDLADFIIGLAVVLTSSIIYKKHKTKKSGVIALICSSIVWIVTALIANYFVLVPFYIELFFEGSIEAFIGMCKIIPGINESNYMTMYLLVGALPFNFVISTIVSLVTFFVYKKISILLDKMEDHNNDETN